MGHAPGRVAEFDGNLQLVAEHPSTPPDDGFNPHGIAARPELNPMVTSDFICPMTTPAATPGGLDLRGSIRVWDLSHRTILRTIKIPYAGTAVSVFDFSSIQKGGWPQLMRMTEDGKRLFITMNQAGKVVMFDTSDPAHPKVLRTLDLGAASGPHYLRLTEDERRLVVSDYFLNEDSMGKVHAEGDHRVHVIRVEHRNMELDPRFELNFNSAFATGPARPHGMAFK